MSAYQNRAHTGPIAPGREIPVEHQRRIIAVAGEVNGVGLLGRRGEPS